MIPVASRPSAAARTSAALLLGLAPAAPAAPGDPDFRFHPLQGGNRNITAITVQSDQRILIINNNLLVRLLSNGDLDASPLLVAQIPFEVSKGPRSVALMSDGSILVVGTLDNDAAIAKFTPLGYPDLTFGTEGVRKINLAREEPDSAPGQFHDSVDEGAGIAVLPGDKIILTGLSRQVYVPGSVTGTKRVAIASLSGTGAPQEDAVRVITTGFPAADGGEEAALPDLGVLPDGKAAALAYYAGGAGTGIMNSSIITFDSADAPQIFPLPKEGASGPYSAGVVDHALAFAARADGSLVLTGRARIGRYEQPDVTSTFFMGGLSAPGAATYALPPVVTSAVPGSKGTSVVIQADGKIITGGTTLQRFLPNGALDPEFFAPSIAGVKSIALMGDGTLLVSTGNSLQCLETTGTGGRIEVEQPPGTPLTSGVSTVNFGNVVMGSTVSLSFQIKNTDPFPPGDKLFIHGVTIDGPSAAAMSVSRSPAGFFLDTSDPRTLTVDFTPVAGGPATARLRIVSNDADKRYFDIALTGTGMPAGGPEISVETDAGAALPATGTTVTLSQFRPEVTWTVRNTGAGPLTGLALTKAGTHPERFTVTPDLPATLAPGASVQFTTAFTGFAASLSPGEAVVRIASNDADENPVEITLRGNPSGTSASWRETFFGSANSIDDAADTADPDRDGVVNLLEYATATRPDRSGDPGPAVTFSGDMIQYTWRRPKAALNECTWTVEWTDLLNQAVWSTTGTTTTVVSDDGRWQEVKATVPAPAAGNNRFVRLRVARRL